MLAFIRFFAEVRKVPYEVSLAGRTQLRMGMRRLAMKGCILLSGAGLLLEG